MKIWEKISNILNAQKNANKIESYKYQICSLRNQVEALKAKSRLLKNENEALKESNARYLENARETRLKRNEGIYGRN